MSEQNDTQENEDAYVGVSPEYRNNAGVATRPYTAEGEEDIVREAREQEEELKVDTVTGSTSDTHDEPADEPADDGTGEPADDGTGEPADDGDSQQQSFEYGD